MTEDRYDKKEHTPKGEIEVLRVYDINNFNLLVSIFPEGAYSVADGMELLERRQKERHQMYSPLHEDNNLSDEIASWAISSGAVAISRNTSKEKSVHIKVQSIHLAQNEEPYLDKDHIAVRIYVIKQPSGSLTVLPLNHWVDNNGQFMNATIIGKHHRITEERYQEILSHEREGVIVDTRIVEDNLDPLDLQLKDRDMALELVYISAVSHLPNYTYRSDIRIGPDTDPKVLLKLIAKLEEYETRVKKGIRAGYRYDSDEVIASEMKRGILTALMHFTAVDEQILRYYYSNLFGDRIGEDGWVFDQAFLAVKKHVYSDFDVDFIQGGESGHPTQKHVQRGWRVGNRTMVQSGGYYHVSHTLEQARLEIQREEIEKITTWIKKSDGDLLESISRIELTIEGGDMVCIDKNTDPIRVGQLIRKLEEYTIRLPEQIQTNTELSGGVLRMKRWILYALLTNASVYQEVVRTHFATYPELDMEIFDLCFDTIKDYLETGGINVIQGTGLTIEPGDKKTGRSYINHKFI